MKKKIRQYRGSLTPAQVTDGIAVAQANARRLLDDAKLLLNAGRYPSATALAILSLEERGKVQILKRLALLREEGELKKAWGEYRDHRAKNAGWILPELVAQGARTMLSLSAAVDPKAEHAATLDALKQVSLYTDCCGKTHWGVPEAVIDEGLARSVCGMAERMWLSRTVTLREVELWVEHVKPYYDQPSMTAAVISFQQAMFEEGLSETTPERLEAFMRGRPVPVEVSATKA